MEVEGECQLERHLIWTTPKFAHCWLKYYSLEKIELSMNWGCCYSTNHVRWDDTKHLKHKLYLPSIWCQRGVQSQNRWTLVAIQAISFSNWKRKVDFLVSHKTYISKPLMQKIFLSICLYYKNLFCHLVFFLYLKKHLIPEKQILHEHSDKYRSRE